MAKAVVKPDPRVEAYIANAAPFARPILVHLRKLVHTTCPEAEETIKWSFPAFMYHGILCGMAAFKEHCSFGFWHPLMRDIGDKRGMGNYGRITSIKDLPADGVLKKQIKTAMAHHASGIKPPKTTKPRQKLSTPADLVAALKKAPKALATFEAFSPTNKRDYIEWITEAKRPETRAKRLATSVEWLAAGRKRNWKYENC